MMVKPQPMLITETDWPAASLAFRLIRPDIRSKERLGTRRDSVRSRFRFLPWRKFVVAPPAGQLERASDAEPHLQGVRLFSGT
jgi:hypothetical protein